MRGKSVRRRRRRRHRCRRRDIDRAGAVIGKTCLSILQSIIERHCHVNGNRIEIAMEMAAPRRAAPRRRFLLRLSASVLAARPCYRSIQTCAIFIIMLERDVTRPPYMRGNFKRSFLSASVRSMVFHARFFSAL